MEIISMAFSTFLWHSRAEEKNPPAAEGGRTEREIHRLLKGQNREKKNPETTGGARKEALIDREGDEALMRINIVKVSDCEWLTFNAHQEEDFC